MRYHSQGDRSQGAALKDDPGDHKSSQEELTVASDEYCPHCDNHFVLEAVTPDKNPAIAIKSTDVRVDSSMLGDVRVKDKGQSISIFDPDEEADKLG